MNFTGNDSTLLNFCRNRREQFLAVGSQDKTVLSSVMGSLASIGVVTNSMVIIMFCVTKQLENQSFRMIFYATIMELLANVATFYKLPIIVIPNQLACEYLMIERFISPFTLYGTRYMICVIAVDRLMRIKFLHDYQIKFTTFWRNTTLIIYLACVLYQSVVAYIFFTSRKTTSISKYSIPVNLVVFFLFIGLYTKSFIILKQHIRASRNVSSNDNDIIKITKCYFILYLVSCAALFAINISHWIHKPTFEQHFNNKSKIIDFAFLDLNPTLVGIINAVAIMKINRVINAKITRWISGKIIKTKKISCSQKESNENIV